MADTLDQVSLRLGEILARLTALESQGEKAAESRSRTQAALEEIRATQAALAASMAAIDRRVSRIEPEVDALSRLREQGRGLWLLATLALGGLGAGAVEAAQRLLR